MLDKLFFSVYIVPMATIVKIFEQNTLDTKTWLKSCIFVIRKINFFGIPFSDGYNGKNN